MKMRILALLVLLVTVLPTGNRTVLGNVQQSGPTWVKTPGTVPEGFGSMVYDSARQRTVGFAYNYDAKQLEMWEYDGRSWSKKTTVASARTTASARNAVYDSKRNRIVLFGLVDVSSSDYAEWKNLSETWEFDGNAWSKKNTAALPTLRSDFAMVYDSNRSRTVLFGGITGDPDNQLLGDTWEYDGTNWIKQNPSTSPSPRSGPAMAYDSTRKLVILFGGRGEGCCPPKVFSDTWEYDGARWVQKNTTSTPPPRTQAALAFDKGRARTVLFGGGEPNPTLKDTWEYDGANWTESETSGSPAHRSEFGFVYDEARNRIVLAGGGFWCQTIECMNQPLFRANSVSIADDVRYSTASATRKSNLLLGGGGPRNDTWEYSTQGGAPRLVITKVELDPGSPKEGYPGKINLTIENQGERIPYMTILDYSGEYTITGDPLGTRQFAFRSGSLAVPDGSTHWGADKPQPFSVTRWFLTINAYYGRAVNPGQLRITIRPKNVNVPALSVSHSIVVTSSAGDLAAKCSVAVARVVADTLSGMSSSNIRAAGKALEVFVDAGTAQFLCKPNDYACQGDKVSEMIIKSQIPDADIAYAIAGVGDTRGLGECYIGGRWVGELVKAMGRRGKAVNMQGVHSPATIMVTNQEGQRVGMLDNGSLVQDIPGSRVIIVGEEKYVFYPPTSATTTRLKGTGTGTMTVEMITNDGNKAGHEVVYKDVPVTRNAVAQVSSADTQATLNVDNNGDGRVDQSRRPDAMQAISYTPTGSNTFKETGKVVSGRLWQMWLGGRSYEDSLYINGLPLTDKRPEVNPTDGKTYQTQWFERARLEEHPENQPPFDVLLGLLGTRAAQGRQDEAFKPLPDPNNGLLWFKETGHTLGDANEGGLAIASYWLQLGGLEQFGYPISQPFVEVNKENGKQYLVQYFERQRFEYHPENKGTRYEVLLGRLGAEQMGR